jgi:LacI family transcriptional regulator
MRGDLGFVSATTAAKVRHAAEQLGYHPSQAAQALARGRTMTVGMVYLYPHLAHHQSMLRAVRGVVDRYGYQMLHAPVEPTGGPAPSLLLSERRADIVVLAGTGGAAEAPDWLTEPHQIVVAAGAKGPFISSRVLTACWDDRVGLRQALEHLTELGHRHVAFLAGFDQDKPVFFREAAAELGLRADVVSSDVTAFERFMHDGADMARQALQLEPRPTALLARNDDIAVGAIHAVAEAGVHVPRDLSVVGYFDTPGAQFSNPSLTSVATPFTECVTTVLTEALAAAVARREAELEPRLIEFPTRLQARASSGRAASRVG